jgi:hypothetical protein
MDFARIIREIEEEILRLEQVKSLLRGEAPVSSSNEHPEKELSPEKQEKSAEDRTSPHSS